MKSNMMEIRSDSFFGSYSESSAMHVTALLAGNTIYVLYVRLIENAFESLFVF